MLLLATSPVTGCRLKVGWADVVPWGTSKDIARHVIRNRLPQTRLPQETSFNTRIDAAVGTSAKPYPKQHGVPTHVRYFIVALRMARRYYSPRYRMPFTLWTDSC